MHRHGYKGRKFHRETDQRSALMKGLAVSLIKHGKIETTLPKAKDLRPFFEKLITTAKVNDLATRRRLIAKLSNVKESNKLIDEIAPKLSDRSSGYLRIKTSRIRRGDNAQLATIEFVDNLKTKASSPTASPTIQSTTSPDKPDNNLVSKTASKLTTSTTTKTKIANQSESISKAKLNNQEG